MAAGVNLQHRLVAQLGPAVLPCRRHLCQPRQDIQGGQHLPGLQKKASLPRDPIAQSREQFEFALVDLFLGRENLFLIFLQLRGDVALRVLERLLALVVGRNLVDVSMRDLDVVAENLIKAHLQARNAGAGDFLRLKLRNPLLAAPGNSVQLVERGVVAAADNASFARS